MRRAIQTTAAVASASAATLCLLGFVATPALGAEPSLLRQFCPTGSGAGQCRAPVGIAIHQASGHSYIGDAHNFRLVEFDAWGQFLKAWGWDVVQSGPGNTGTSFEVCVVANGDVCKAGVSGSGRGQFGSGSSSPRGVTIDTDGNVYVVDDSGVPPVNHRVQKFDEEGNFLMMFGGQVNKTKVEENAPGAQQNRCPVDPEDICQAGVQGTGQGQFGTWPGGNFIDVSPDGEIIYIGDQDRIQEFDTEGQYIGEIALPETGVVNALAVDKAPFSPNFGDIYFSYVSKLAPFPAAEAVQPDVHRLDPVSGEEVGSPLKVALPGTLATDIEGNVYIFDRELFITNGDPRNRESRILKFDASGKQIDQFFEGGFVSVGLATSSSCGLESPNLYVSNPDFFNGFVGIYGPPPDPDVCPPPEEPPAISAQYVLSVGSEGATVRAEINPRFWPDTRYYVQYGTGKCFEGGCGQEQPLPPGTLLTDKVKDAVIATNGVFLGNLEPATAYHYRFVAESGSGGPAFGEEETLTTYPLPPKPKTDCPNQAFRSGLSAPLPDCRAYELVSPLDKSNGDIVNDEAAPISPSSNYEESSPGGERATYSSIRSFGDPEGAPLISQYLSSRDPVSGWSTHSIAPPRDSVPFYGPGATVNTVQFKAFSEDLCRGWLIQDTDVALVPGAPPGVANIYRRSDGDCGKEGFDLTTPIPPPGFPTLQELKEGESSYFPEVQGTSANDTQTLLRIDAVLAENACKTTPGTEEGRGISQLYLHTIGETDLDLVSVLPSGMAACVHASGGTKQSAPGEPNEDNALRALADDGSRVFWSTSASSQRENPFTGGGGNHPGPLYLRLNPTKPPSAQALGSALGTGDLNVGAKVISGVKTTSGAFAIGQSISGEGIPAGATITAVGATTITLSLAATQKLNDTALEAWSACTEPETKACTLPISSANDTRFWGADPEGGAAIYTASGGLHKYDVEEETSTTIAPSGALGVMGMSTDLSRVYFASTADLTGEQENSEGDKAAAGKPNLYLYEEGGGIVFVGGLASRDTSNGAISSAPPSPIATLPNKRISRISADGLHAAFTSAASLTGYDNTDVASGKADAEVFLYDAAPGGAGELRCVSCNPSGARPRGLNVHAEVDPAELEPYWAAALIPGWETQFHPTRALSADGNRLFFESFEGLVLRDTNGVRDVYQWQRAANEEECEEAGAELFVQSAGGCISLISSGKSSLGSEFLDASADGRDAFITTAASLLPHDPGLIDVYDAREGGGFPPPPVPKPPCEGEACQPSPAPPEDPTPASSAFQGAGNVIEQPRRGRKPCGKGKRRVRRGGKSRCVKRQTRNRKHAKARTPR